MGHDLLDVNDVQGEHAPSWYAATANPFPNLETAAGSLKYDVAIIGGGFSGLSSALHLSQLGYKVCVLEAHRIGWGASGRNGGQVGTGQRVGPQELEQLVDKAHARQAFDLGVEATQLVKDLIKNHKIDCDFRSGIIDAHHKKRYDKHGPEEVEHFANHYDYHSLTYLPPEELTEKIGSPDYSGGILDSNTGHLHPLNYALGLAKAAIDAGAELFELSRVSEIIEGKPHTVKTQKAEITAEHVVLACNGYLGKLDRHVADRVMPINNFIIASEPLDEETAKSLIRDGEAVADTRFVVNYFRLSADNRMLFGGGENYGYRFPKDIVAKVRKPMLKVFPQLKDTRIDYAWGGTLAITYNRLPVFQFRPNGIVSVSGYSGSGVHMASLAGKLVAEAIDGQMARFDIMAQLPTPKFPGGAALRWPLLPLAMIWYAMRDHL